MKKFVFLLLPFISVASWGASCPTPTWTASNQVKLNEGPVMIVTHPSTQWDGRFVSKLGMDAAVAFAKQQKVPVIYLQDSAPSNNQTYFFSDCNPTYWVSSSGGEFNFNVPSRHVLSVGGHWEMCQKTTLKDLFYNNWSKVTEGNLRLTQIMDGIYSYPTDYMYSSDPYYKDLTAFLKIVTYGRPSNWPFPKTSLLENMGIINDSQLQIQYLKRNLPPYQQINPKYTVELVINGKQVEVLRQGTGANPPTLTLEFYNTAYRGGSIPSFADNKMGRRCQTKACLRNN